MQVHLWTAQTTYIFFSFSVFLLSNEHTPHTHHETSVLDNELWISFHSFVFLV
jgi:hypothetical protein